MIQDDPNHQLAKAAIAGDMAGAEEALKNGASLSHPFYVDIGITTGVWEFIKSPNQRNKAPQTEGDGSSSVSAVPLPPLPWAVFHKHFLDVLDDLYDGITDEMSSSAQPANDKVRHLNAILKKLKADPTNDIYGFWDFPLGIAAYLGHLDLVKLFVAKGADVGAFASSALRYASISGHIEIVEFLLEQGADVCALNYWAIRYSIRYAQYDTALVLGDYIIKNDKWPHTKYDPVTRTEIIDPLRKMLWETVLDNSPITIVLQERYPHLYAAYDQGLLP
jgi:hypothetical protein